MYLYRPQTHPSDGRVSAGEERASASARSLAASNAERSATELESSRPPSLPVVLHTCCTGNSSRGAGMFQTDISLRQRLVVRHSGTVSPSPLFSPNHGIARPRLVSTLCSSSDPSILFGRCHSFRLQHQDVTYKVFLSPHSQIWKNFPFWAAHVRLLGIVHRAGLKSGP